MLRLTSNSGQVILHLNMKTVKAKDVEEAVCSFEFKINRRETMHGFGSWFDVEFCPLTKDAEMVILKTGPDSQ